MNGESPSTIKSKVFIDTNIFLYSHDISDPLKKLKAEKLIYECYTSENCAISFQVLAEFYQNYVVKFKNSYIDALKELHFMCRCHVVENSVRLLAEGTKIHHENPVSFWDSMILAAANEAEAKILFSEDMNHQQDIAGIRIINPFYSNRV